MRRLICAALVASSMTAPNAWAVFSSADVLRPCSAKNATPEDVICEAYVEGYIECMDATKVSVATNHLICIPDKETTDQVRRTITAFLASNADARSRDAPTMVAVALAKAYPCK